MVFIFTCFLGEYEIRVLQPRSQARKDKKPQYWMSINIKVKDLLRKYRFT